MYEYDEEGNLLPLDFSNPSYDFRSDLDYEDYDYDE